MPHRLENESEMQALIDRILAIMDTSIPVASRPPLHTLPEFPDMVASSPTDNPSTTPILPKSSVSISPESVPTDLLSSMENISTDCEPTAKHDDGTHLLLKQPGVSSATLLQTPSLSLQQEPEPIHPLSEYPQIPQINKEVDQNPAPREHLPSDSSPPSYLIEPLSPPLSFSPHPLSSPHNDHRFHTRVLVVTAALAVSIAVVWTVMRRRR